MDVERVDHVIIGAGLAGLVLRRFLRDRNVVLLDPAPFSYKIGESVVPEQFGHPEMRALVPAVRALPSYSLKAGTTFVSAGSVASFPLPPAEAGVSCHVSRHELEAMIAERWSISIVREKVIAVDVERRRVTTTARVYESAGPILDCSGPAMVIANALGEVERLFPTSATWAYWDIESSDSSAFHRAVRERGLRYLRFDAMRRRVLPGGDELPGWAPERTTLLTRLDGNVWTWQIPLHDARVLSYGVISRGEPIDEASYRRIALEGASPGYRLRPRSTAGPSPYDRVHTRAGFARRARRAASRDFVLLADAYAFADPVYSVGTALAVNRAIEIAEVLRTSGWTDEACARYARTSETLLARAMQAFDFWYRGEVLTSDEAAREVQSNFLVGTAFQVDVARHYGNVSTDALWAGDHGPRAASAREEGGFGLDVAVEDHVYALLGGAELAGWSLAAATTTRGGLLLRWRREGKPDLEMRVAFAHAGAARPFRTVGSTALSYESLIEGAYPFDASVDALFRALGEKLAPREDDWRSVWRLAVPAA